MLSKINKEVGTWDAKNTSQLDDYAYATYCNTTIMVFGWNGFDNKTLSTPLKQTEFMLLHGRDLKCFYDIAKKELRIIKIKNLKNGI